MADSIMSEYATLKLEMAADEIQNCYNYISRQNSEAKKYISLIIVYVMTSEEVAGTEDWNVAEKAIEYGKKSIGKPRYHFEQLKIK